MWVRPATCCSTVLHMQLCTRSHCTTTLRAMWDGCYQPGFLPAAWLQYCSVAHASAHAAYEIARCKPGWMVLTWTNLACHRLQRCTSTTASAACCSEVKSAFDERLHVGSWVRWLWREPTWPVICCSAAHAFPWSLLCCSQSVRIDQQSVCTLQARWDGCNTNKPSLLPAAVLQCCSA